ncbi:MAG TPA: hypothetical protein PKE39_03775 [Ignavibacteria bacterium]|nr:hypothetical protein [Ignavibacteria bacterium]HMQ98119.1 hypothetical protein [Ignavibacteria bacterium]
MDIKQAELELSEIKRIMEDSRRIMVDDGTGFILWGSLVAIGLISSYLSVLGYIEWNITSIAWFALIGLGWLITIFQLRREKKERKAVSFAGKVAGAIWGSAGITMTIIGFVGSYTGLVKGMGISPLMACVLAAAFFVSGVIYNDKTFRYLSFGWWAGALVMFFWYSPHTLLLFALMIIFMQVLPGYLMYNKWKKENNAA